MQKAAIALVAFGPEVSSHVMRGMPETELEAITVEIANLRDVPPEIEEKVVEECHQIFMAREYISQGGVDFAHLLRSLEGMLHLIPRYRQKLEWTPVIEQPVWVDDREFNLDYHVRHTALPRPGTTDQLNLFLAGRDSPADEEKAGKKPARSSGKKRKPPSSPVTPSAVGVE